MVELCIKREILIWMLALLAMGMINVMELLLGYVEIQKLVILVMRLVYYYNCFPLNFFFLASNDDVEIESKCSNLLVSVASDTFA